MIILSLVVQLAGAMLTLFVVNRFGLLQHMGSPTSPQTLINAHIFFSLLLLFTIYICNRLKVPFVQFLEIRLIEQENDAVDIRQRWN